MSNITINASYSFTQISSINPSLSELKKIENWMGAYFLPVGIILSFLTNSLVLIIIHGSPRFIHSTSESVRIYYLSLCYSDILLTFFYFVYQYICMFAKNFIIFILEDWPIQNLKSMLVSVMLFVIFDCFPGAMS